MPNTKSNTNSEKRSAVISNGRSAVAAWLRAVVNGIVGAAVTAYDRAQPHVRSATNDAVAAYRRTKPRVRALAADLYDRTQVRSRVLANDAVAAYRRAEPRVRAFVADLYNRAQVRLGGFVDSAVPVLRGTSVRVRVAGGFAFSLVLVVAVTLVTFGPLVPAEYGSTDQESRSAFMLPDGPDGEQNTAAALEMLWRDAGMTDSNANDGSGNGLFSQPQEPPQVGDDGLVAEHLPTAGMNPTRQFYTSTGDSAKDNRGERMVNAMNSLAKAASGMGVPSLAPAPTPGISTAVLAKPTATPGPGFSSAPPEQPVTLPPAPTPTQAPTSTPAAPVVVVPVDEARFVPAPESEEDSEDGREKKEKEKKDREEKRNHRNKKATPTSTPAPVAVSTLAPTRIVPTATPAPVATSTPAPEPIAAIVPTATPALIAAPEPIIVAEPTMTATPAATSTPAPTATPVATATAEPTKTATPEPTATPAATSTPEPTATPAPVLEPTPILSSSTDLTEADIFAMYKEGRITYDEMLLLLAEYYATFG